MGVLLSSIGQIIRILSSEKSIIPDGTEVVVPHRGRMKKGKVVRYDKGNAWAGEGPAYVVDVGEYESILVPPHEIELR